MDSDSINSLRSFVSRIETLASDSESYLFRGQPIRGNLLPSIARRDPSKNTAKLEKRTIEQLSLLGASLMAGIEPTILDKLVLAQHHGLKTRLLDWTSNPLAALWFACSYDRKGDVYVYALNAKNLQLSQVYDQNPFATSKTRVFQPRFNNPMIIAQNGWFTLHRYSKTIKRFVALEKNSDINKSLSEFVIPGSRRTEILHSLDRHGVSYRTLFPDLGGLCRHLNWKNKLG